MGTNNNTKQIGGTHYKTEVQHWDWAQYIPYLEGCATKYIGRHTAKNGLEDIEKSLSFIAKIVERDYGAKLNWAIAIDPASDRATETRIPREYVNPDCGPVNVAGADCARNSY